MGGNLPPGRATKRHKVRLCAGDRAPAIGKVLGWNGYLAYNQRCDDRDGSSFGRGSSGPADRTAIAKDALKIEMGRFQQIRWRPTGLRWGALGALVALVCGAAPAGAQQKKRANVKRVNVANILPAVRSVGTASSTATAPPLVHVDEELGGYLSQAERLIKEGAYSQAIEILQALIQREESGFFAEAGNRFVSMRLKANELLGRMAPKGLKLYRALYDSQAQQLYTEALASRRPEMLLRRLSERYLHTSYGLKSLETLGALYFDRGCFSQAAGCWHRLLSVAETASARSAVLAKVAAAHHMAGEAAAAGRAEAELRKKYPSASGTLGGREQKLADFVARVRKLAPVGAGGMPIRRWQGWPGLGGVPDGVASMSDCDVVLAPRWRLGPQRISSGENLLSKLVVGASMYMSNRGRNPYGGRNVSRRAQLRNGHLFSGTTVSGRQQRKTLLPAMVHPVVVGEQVIVRLEDKVVGHDLLTGESLWETVGSLSMVRKMAHVRNMGVYYGGGYQYIGDSGRYTLTVGGGRAYTVCDFLPSGNNFAYMVRQNRNIKDVDDGSVLAALLLEADGRLHWRKGRGQGDHEVVRNGQFLSAPTYRAERLYVLMLYLERYYLVCLDASDGSMIWHAPVAQAPAMARRYGYQLGTDPRLTVGSAPAVADGRVFVTTNSGVVAAFGEETGEPLWGYQYASTVNNGSNLTAGMIFRGGNLTAVYRSANPVIVSGRRVICLPADSDYLLALDAAKGSLLWNKSRRNQNDLSAVDRDRVLLSGRGLFVFRASDGAELNGGSEDLGIHGRPAVSSRRVLASAQGKIEVMDLTTYRTSPMPLAAADGLLGNLVSADGKLIAANMLGICTYFGYDVARAELTKRMGQVPVAKRPALLRQQAQLAFDAGRFDVALADLNACKAAAEAQNDKATGARLSQMFYRTYVALGNHARGDGMLRMFAQALSYAVTDQDKGHMKFRLAKYYEKAGQYAKAAELAQEMAERFADEELAEVEIGPEADDSVRFGPRERTVPGDRLARDYLRGLLEKYGRECYAKFDALAKQALGAALAAGDPNQMLTVAKRWPNSEWQDDALFRASEAYYLKAAEDRAKADDYLAEARRHLFRVARTDDSPLRFSASVALATIYARGGWVTSARKECEALRELPGETQVAFADIRGKLTDVLKIIEGGKLPKTARRMRLVARISPPLAELFALKDTSITVLRDQEYQPIRVGEKIAVVKGSEVYLLDTTARGAGEALSGWKGLAGIDKDGAQRFAYYPPGMRLIGGLSRERNVLVVADRKTLRGLELVSAKIVWQRQMEKIDIRSFYCMGVGCGVVVVVDNRGKVSCLNIADGKLLWQSALVGGARHPVGPPRVAGDVVVLRHNGGKTVTCISLAKGGRVIGKWQATQWAECEITDDGLVLLMLDGELTVREPAKIDKPLWRRKYDFGKQPSILGASSDHVAVSPSNTSGPVEILSITGGRKTASLETAPVGGMPGVPFSVRFAGGDAFVLCAAGMSGRRKAVYGRLSSSRGVALQKFRLSDGRRLWDRNLEDNMGMYFPNVLPLVIGKDHVVVTARHYQINMPYHAYVVDSRTGQVKQKIDLQGKGAGAQKESRRRQGIGQPVMTNGRLCVETSEGVTVYGDK